MMSNINVTLLPDGSAFTIASIKRKSFLKRWHHKLFKCPTFWQRNPSFTCPSCGGKYRCYWDGNDIAGHGINYCNDCAKRIESSH